MKTIIEIKNNWDEKTLISTGEWVNDGRESWVSIEEAEEFIKGHEDEERLRVSTYEIEIEE